MKNIWNVFSLSAVKIIFLVEIIYLFLLSVFSTNVYQTLEDGQIFCFNLDDQIWKHAISIVVFLSILCISFLMIKNKKIEEWVVKTKLGKALPWIIIILYALFLFWFVISYQLFPTSDAFKVYRIAGELLNGDCVAYLPEGYLNRYPDQIEIVLFNMFLKVLFGEMAYVVFQLFNIILIIMDLYVIKRLCCLFWKEGVTILAVTGLVLFLPLSAYATYNYGTVPGMSFSLLAIYYLVRAVKEERGLLYALSIFCIGMAFFFKTNSLIFAIGIFLYLMYEGVNRIIEKKKDIYISFISAIMILMMIGVVSLGSERIMQSITGYETPEGMPKTTWIAMGLNEQPDRPGAWDGTSLRFFEEANYNYEIADENAKEHIKWQLNKYIKNPDKMAEFVAKKIAWQWNNPTFCFSERLLGRTSVNQNNSQLEFLNSLSDGKGRYLVIDYMNYYQTIILFGIIIYLTIRWKHITMMELLPAIGFTGGFLFHLFWEGKPEYVFPYFCLLIFYGMCGYYSLMNRTYEKIFVKKEIKQYIQRSVKICVLCFLVLLLFRQTNIFEQMVELRASEERCAEYEIIKAEKCSN